MVVIEFSHFCLDDDAVITNVMVTIQVGLHIPVFWQNQAFNSSIFFIRPTFLLKYFKWYKLSPLFFPAWYTSSLVLHNYLWDLSGFTTSCFPNQYGGVQSLYLVNYFAPGWVYRKVSPLLLKFIWNMATIT